MSSTFKAGLIQTNVSNEMADNVAFVREQARLARDAGADFVMTPENTGLIGANRTETLAKAQTEETHAMLAAARASARETGAWFLLGSIHVRVPGEEQIRNRSYLIDASGAVVASYDKIHMFDVQLNANNVYRESDSFAAGGEAVIAPLQAASLGMTVCYDVRFSDLYRQLAVAGAQIIAVPAAFTRITGEAHWHILLRSRAIETGCFIIAPAQGGKHEDGRETYGHSLIIDPWGEILAEAGTEPAVISATLDLAKVDEARRKIPSLSHVRPFHPVGKA